MAPAQVMISYRVPETGPKVKGGDGFAAKLRDGLLASGYTVFLDVDNLEGGDEFATVIQSAMRACAAVVAICSSTYASKASPWTRQEFMYAKELGKPIVPVYHSGPWPSEEIGLALAGINYIAAGHCKKKAPGVATNEVVVELVRALEKVDVQPVNSVKSQPTSAGCVELWSAVDCDDSAKAIFKGCGLTPHVAARMVARLGVSHPSDLRELVAEDVLMLSLLPVKARQLRKLIEDWSSGGSESPPSSPESPSTFDAPRSSRSSGNMLAPATRAAPRQVSRSSSTPLPALKMAPLLSPLAGKWDDRPRTPDEQRDLDEADAARKSPQALYYAAAHGQAHEVSRLLQLGVADTWRDENAAGSTCLQIAATYGHLSVVQLLLASGSDPSRSDKDGRTPLYTAARENRLDVAALLIANSATLDQSKRDGQTPLFAAACCGHKGMVTMLVAKGARINMQNQNGETSLFISAAGGKYDVVLELLRSQANVNQPNKKGQTPLFVAAWRSRSEIAKVLLAHNASADLADTNGQTPLLMAAWMGSTKVASVLLERNAETELADEEGRTPLYAAACEGFVTVAKMLLACGAGVNNANKRGETPLYIAALQAQEDIVQALLSNGAEVDKADQAGQTPLYAAASKGHTHVAELLIARGAKVDKALRSARQASVPSPSVIKWLTLQSRSTSKSDYA